MNTGPMPDFQEVTEGSCNLSDTSTIAKAGVDCNSVTVQNQEFGVEHTQPDLLEPKSGEGEADISDSLIYSQWICWWKCLSGEGFEKIVEVKNLFCDLFGWAGVGMIRRSNGLFDHMGNKPVH
jgi:hypothetical protein